MAQYTSRANLTLPGGGSSGTITPDEPADIDVLNENFRKIDALLGAQSVPTAGMIPGNAMDGQVFWVQDSKQVYVYDADAGGGVSASNKVPAGAIMMFASNTPPTGWLMAEGQTVSRSLYPELFTAIGTTFGNGDGSTTFHLPNFKGRVPTGRDAAQTEFNTLAKTGGAKTHTLTTAQMPSHNHTATTGGAGSHTHSIHGGNAGSNAKMRSSQSDGGGTVSSYWHPWFGTGYNGIDNVQTSNPGNHTHSVSVANQGGGQAHPILQPYLTINFIISTGR